MPWKFAAASDIGGRNEQQDRMAVLHGIDDRTHLLVVADGAGGHGNGALAAQTVIETLEQHFAQGLTAEPLGFVENICLSAHEAVMRLESTADLPPASTCVVLLLHDQEAYWAHVGDSRLYHLRGEQVLSRTVDHSLVELCKKRPGSGVFNGQDEPAANQLYMCLGARCEIAAETNASVVSPDDSFLLCSDGFWNQVGIDEVAGSLRKKDFDDRAAREWVQRAKSRGGNNADNISLLCARLMPSFRERLILRAKSQFARIGRPLFGRG